MQSVSYVVLTFPRFQHHGAVAWTNNVKCQIMQYDKVSDV